MGRMGSDGYSSGKKARVGAKVSEELKEEFRTAADSNGESMTDVLRRKMEEYVVEHGEGGRPDVLPDDDDLRESYQRLRQLADPDSQRVDAEVARAELAKLLGRPESTVRRSVFDPLKRRGYIAPRWGAVRVFDPDELVTADGTSGVPADD